MSGLKVERLLVHFEGSSVARGSRVTLHRYQQSGDQYSEGDSECNTQPFCQLVSRANGVVVSNPSSQPNPLASIARR